jgi:hypothetical protein
MNTDNPTLDVIRNLHTTHGGFADKPLPPDDLQAILAASVRAATASNMRSSIQQRNPRAS